MKLGVQLNSFDWEGGPERFATRLAEIARASEEAGFDRIAVADHVWQHPIMGGPEANELECYAMLAFLAANTERVGLGDGAGDRLPGTARSHGVLHGPRPYHFLTLLKTVPNSPRLTSARSQYTAF